MMDEISFEFKRSLLDSKLYYMFQLLPQRSQSIP